MKSNRANAVSNGRRLLGGVIAMLLTPLAAAAGIESVDADSPAAVEQRPITLRGVIQQADGTPVADAVVVSAAGGKAVSGDDGMFELTVDVEGVEPLRLTAAAVIRHVNHNAAALVNVAASEDLVDAGSLVMSADGECVPAWLPMFDGPGPNNDVMVMTVYDDGDGPTLYVGGKFTSIGGIAANRIAKWDGVSWSPLALGLNGEVRALTVFGSILYVGGSFTGGSGMSANNIASWNGSSWSPLGSGVNSTVFAMAVFLKCDPPAGHYLYVGGQFAVAGGVSANFIARWDGSNWHSVGGGMNHLVRALKVLPNPYYPFPPCPEVLYAGGFFTVAGGQAVNHVAGYITSWFPLGNGFDDVVLTLAAHDDGSGVIPTLHAGGAFVTSGGTTVNRVANFDPILNKWYPIGNGMSGHVQSLTFFDDGSGVALYAGGWFITAGGTVVNRVAKWDGDSWSGLGSGLGPEVYALAVYDDELGDGPTLFASGTFTSSPTGDSYLTSWRCAPAPACASADLNCDGVVNVADLLILLANWGSCPPGGDCSGDLNDDGVVNVADLLMLLAAWG